jgi:hypothetical protein
MPVRFGGRGKAFFVPTPIATPKIRPVGYGVILAGVRTIENVFGLTWATSLSRIERSLNALAAFQTISTSVSRSFRKRSIPWSRSSNNIGHRD